MPRNTASARVDIFFRATGLAGMNAKTNAALKGMKTRATYYAGMIQARLGYAFAAAGVAIAAFSVLSVKKFAELCETLNPPPVLSGYDLIVLGYKPGPTYRQILTAVENQQLSGKLTTYEEAVQFVQDNWEVENDELSKRASLFTA